MDGAAPKFSLSLKVEHFVLEGGLSFAEAYARAPGGHFGRVLYARWTAGCSPPIDVALKVQVGEAPGSKGIGGLVSRDEFVTESQILLNVRMLTAPVGFAHLCYAYGTGVEDASAYLPVLPPGDGLPARPTPPGTPLFLIAMEPLTGGTLRQRQLGPSPATGSALVRAALDLCAAVSALHSLGYAHADIKAENVLFDARGRLVLVDYGCGRETSGALYSYGPVAGSQLWRAPELQGAHVTRTNTPAADMWSVGLLLYELMSGGTLAYCAAPGSRRPVPDWQMRAAAGRSPETVAPLPPSAPAPVVDAMRACLVKDPARRATAPALFSSLREAVLGAAPVPAPTLACRSDSESPPGAAVAAADTVGAGSRRTAPVPAPASAAAVPGAQPPVSASVPPLVLQSRRGSDPTAPQTAPERQRSCGSDSVSSAQVTPRILLPALPPAAPGGASDTPRDAARGGSASSVLASPRDMLPPRHGSGYSARSKDSSPSNRHHLSPSHRHHRPEQLYASPSLVSFKKRTSATHSPAAVEDGAGGLRARSHTDDPLKSMAREACGGSTGVLTDYSGEDSGAGALPGSARSDVLSPPSTAMSSRSPPPLPPRLSQQSPAAGPPRLGGGATAAAAPPADAASVAPVAASRGSRILLSVQASARYAWRGAVRHATATRAYVRREVRRALRRALRRQSRAAAAAAATPPPLAAAPPPPRARARGEPHTSGCGGGCAVM